MPEQTAGTRARVALATFGTLAAYMILLTIAVLTAPYYGLPFGPSTAGGTTRLSAVIIIAAGLSSWGALATLLGIAWARVASGKGNSRILWPIISALVCISGTISLSGAIALDLLAHNLRAEWTHLTDPQVRLYQQGLLAGVVISFEWLAAELLAGWEWSKMRIVGLALIKLVAVILLLIAAITIL